MKSIKLKFFLEKCFNGIFFVLIGILEYLDYEKVNHIIPVLTVIAALIFLGVNLILPRFKFEPEDEMTREHENRSQAATYNILTIGLMLFALVCLCITSVKETNIDFVFNWAYAYFLFGGLQIIEYISFLWIEKKGDSIE